MWIGSEISTTSRWAAAHVCARVIPSPPLLAGAGSREACEIRVCQYLYYMRGRLINNFYKECACSWRPPAERKEWNSFYLAWGALRSTGPGHACCVFVTVPRHWRCAAHPGQNFCHKGCCRIWRKCLQSVCGRGYGMRAGTWALLLFRLLDCRLSQRRHSSCLFVCSAYCLPLPPTPANYQHLVYLAYTPGRRHNELSRLSAALYTPPPSTPQLISSCL